MSTTWDGLIGLPETWAVLELDEDGTERLPDELDRLVGVDAELAAHRQVIEASARSLHADCLARAAVAGAVRWAPDHLDGLATGVLMAFVTTRPPRASDDEVVDGLAEALSRPRAGDVAVPQVDRVDLPVGPATRVQVIVETATGTENGNGDGNDGDHGAEPALLVETVQYWVPVHDRDELLLLCFSTPNLAGAERLVDEFDSIAHDLSPAGVG